MLFRDDRTVICSLDAGLHGDLVVNWRCLFILDANLMVARVERRKMESEIFLTLGRLQFLAFRIYDIVSKVFGIGLNFYDRYTSVSR